VLDVSLSFAQEDVCLVKEENTFPPLGLNEDAFQPSFNVYGRDAKVSTGDGIEWSFA